MTCVSAELTGYPQMAVGRRTRVRRRRRLLLRRATLAGFSSRPATDGPGAEMRATVSGRYHGPLRARRHDGGNAAVQIRPRRAIVRRERFAKVRRERVEQCLAHDDEIGLHDAVRAMTVAECGE